MLNKLTPWYIYIYLNQLQAYSLHANILIICCSLLHKIFVIFLSYTTEFSYDILWLLRLLYTTFFKKVLQTHCCWFGLVRISLPHLDRVRFDLQKQRLEVLCYKPRISISSLSMIDLNSYHHKRACYITLQSCYQFDYYGATPSICKSLGLCFIVLQFSAFWNFPHLCNTAFTISLNSSEQWTYLIFLN